MLTRVFSMLVLFMAAPAAKAVPFFQTQGVITEGSEFQEWNFPEFVPEPARSFRFRFTASEPLFLSLFKEYSFWEEWYEADGTLISEGGDSYAVDFFAEAGTRFDFTYRVQGYSRVRQPGCCDTYYILTNSEWLAYGGVDGPAEVGAPIRYRLVVTQVPEPATWALMIAGFGLTGMALRRRAMAPARS